MILNIFILQKLNVLRLKTLNIIHEAACFKNCVPKGVYKLKVVVIEHCLTEVHGSPSTLHPNNSIMHLCTPSHIFNVIGDTASSGKLLTLIDYYPGYLKVLPHKLWKTFLETTV